MTRSTLASDGKAPSSKSSPVQQAAPAASPTSDQDAVRKQALARLPGLYAEARSDPDKYRNQYPGFYDASGKLRPINELKDQINSRYGAK
jgi:hypothetical protein